MARYVVKDTNTGRRYKGLSLDKAAAKTKLDRHDMGWAIEETGRADTDVHTVRKQSDGRPGFAFR